MKIRLSLLSLLVFSHLALLAHSAPCDILGGRSELILDVVESAGEAFDQPIEPNVLPIEGEPGTDIELELSEEGQRRFSLLGKTLNLTRPLDRDENSLSTLRFEISCLVQSSMQIRTIPVVLRIRDINDNAPEFKGAPYHVAVGEDAIVNSPIFNGVHATDRDSGRNGQVEYQVVDISPSGGQDENIFSIRFPHQGAVFLMGPLDYERTPLYRVTVMATDYSENVEDRLNATTTLTVRVQDVDDRDPEFKSAQSPANCTSSEEMFSRCLPEYFSSVVEGGIAGVLDVYPGRIHAVDVDTIGASITYSFKSGTPTSFEKYFSLDSRTAAVRQIKPVDRTQIKRFDIVIQAMENTARRGRATARLLINVEKVDTSPPKLVIPAYTGKVLEASAPGTPVLRDDGSEDIFILSVFDPDIEAGEDSPRYVFELTTSAFEVNEEGVLVVATPNLDRDPPNLSEHTFQAIAREAREGGSASAPVALTVRLQDINDNAPRLPILPTVTVPAGSLEQSVIEVKATDLDEGENAVVTYELLTGSRGKFSIDPETGLITAVGNLEAGEKFFLNIKATDRGNLSSEGFVEVVISKGPNTNGPIFTRAQYSTIIPEDSPHGEEILSVQAKDPEDEISYYSIVDGNVGEVFEMDTLTGILSVVAPLDRETHDQYTLTIRAEDSEGKSNTATALIQVTDVNDEAPSFVGEPFSFRVDEGTSNSSVGVIKAVDRDLGKFGEVEYLLEGSEHLFRIDSKTGNIFTDSSLDYEKEQVHYVSVVAHDMADDPRSATTTVTVLVNDLSDEKPLFPQTTYKVQVPENTAIGSVVATVVAEDKDTVKSITYKMLEGDSRLFKVAPDTGRVTVAGPMDYEEAPRHQLIIGTEENDEDGKQARATVLVEVEDTNDQTPVIDPIHTVTLAKEAPLNTLLMNVSASDADGTSPNNQIHFAFLEAGDVTSYFKINKGNGEIRLKKLLTDANFTELTVKISATDGGEPALSTSTEFRVLLLEGTVETFGDSPVGTLGSSPGEGAQLSSLASSPRFSKDRFELEVRENLPVGSKILKVPLVNTTTSAIMCSFSQGDEEGSFRTEVTREGNCEIISARELDFEEKPSYDLNLVLQPEGFVPGQDQQIPTLSEASVRISILDLNDNSPTFSLKDLDVLEDEPELTVLSFALQNSPIDTNVIHLKAKDLDSGKQGSVEYELLPESNRGNYFGVNSKTGMIFTKRKLSNVPLELQPFNLSLVARDEPTHNQTQQVSTINVIIPIIEEPHRAVLFLGVPKSEATRELDRVKRSIAEATGKIVQIEKVNRGRGSSLQESQLWFHLLEPHSWQPANLENLFEEKKNANFLKNISTSVEGISALKLLSPAQVMESRMEDRKKASKDLEEQGELGGVTKVNTATGLSSLEYALIALAALIILFVIFSIVLVCVLWSRFSKKWNSADKTVMLVPPIIERPASVLESVSKEYEVQVLHMSVPLDDDSVQEMTMEPESPRQLYLDNVSYISKSRNGLEGSSSGGSSGVVTPSALGMDQSGGSFGAWTPDTPAKDSHFSSPHLEGDPGTFSASATNENVMFVRRGFGGPSPVETTTEL